MTTQDGATVKVGIDVGGTFTHAVAVDAARLRVIGKAVVPTTHRAERGVATGVVDSLRRLLDESALEPDQIGLIAHSTTQATNALLEGDVAPVGILAIGTGLAGRVARRQARIDDVRLGPGRALPTSFRWLDADRADETSIGAAIDGLREEGAEVLVSTEMFGVDDASREELVVRVARERGIPATSAASLSKLYGLRMRTRTAVINACMLPKMLRTAEHIEQALLESGIDAPLMVMRSDGGIMDVQSMRERPILTMLSGPAAGVAAALMYERVTDGLFVEVGGTSSDICAIRNGRPIVTQARLGDHRLFLRTLDVRTVGIGGGSIPRVRDRTIHAVGPRSAHIAGVGYEAFRDRHDAMEPSTFEPLDGDPDDYLLLTDEAGGRFTLTPTGAATALSLAEGHARGNDASTSQAFDDVARWLGSTRDEVATRIQERCAEKVVPVLNDLRREHRLAEPCAIVGGGGGAEAVVPFASRQLGLDFHIAKDAEVISAIGAALGMIQETVERSIPEPTEADLARVRREAKEGALRMGAAPETITTTLEVDRQAKVVRAIAQGTPELRSRDLSTRDGLAPTDERRLAAAAMAATEHDTTEVARTRGLAIFRATRPGRRVLWWTGRPRHPVAVLDREGVARLRVDDARVEPVETGAAEERLRAALADLTRYGDGGVSLPEVFLIGPERIADLSGLAEEPQLVAAARLELMEMEPNEPIAIVCAARE